jgi:hypothetical protein
MTNFSPADYGKIGLSFANWRQMAELDKSPFPKPVASSAPPPTIAQEWEGAKSQLAAIPGAFKSAMSGNFSGSQNVVQPNPAPAVAPTPMTAPQSPAYDYDPGIETSFLDSLGQMIEGGSEIASVFA